MGVEIERKFLLASESWRDGVLRTERMVQGYLAESPSCSVRVRVTGDRADLNLKGITVGARRSEFEYPLPLADGQFPPEFDLAGLVVAIARRFGGLGA